ncbi:MAG: hypothetical protein F6K65_25770 [Moorea sp. SIO3C2]|nr:hypothetical protein [Moorena sp. SIO3C2]
MHDSPQLDKFMVCQIAYYSLCLPIRDVMKVVNFTTEISREMKTMGLVQLGKHSRFGIYISSWVRTFPCSALGQSDPTALVD